MSQSPNLFTLNLFHVFRLSGLTGTLSRWGKGITDKEAQYGGEILTILLEAKAFLALYFQRVGPLLQCRHSANPVKLSLDEGYSVHSAVKTKSCNVLIIAWLNFDPFQIFQICRRISGMSLGLYYASLVPVEDDHSEPLFLWVFNVCLQ